ncbi:MAG: hypothetical protein HRT47_12730 [Candidatus Caenarcaniphilales bacterium]|nr:hypothetical protein [Candidatus Caenarcaniphilales bacterium]
MKLESPMHKKQNKEPLTNLKTMKRIHFLGAEGIGMQALITILEEKFSKGELDKDFSIGKSDLSYLKKSDEEKAKIDSRLLTETDLVVRSTAIKENDPDYKFFSEKNIPIIHRSEMLNLVSEPARQIVISGTHGKTSTSALTAHLLIELGLEPGFAIGGILKQYPGNGKAAIDSPEGIFVMEGDESDKSFMRSNPYIAVVTDVEADHLENYPGGLEEIKNCFYKFLDEAEYKIICTNNQILKDYASANSENKKLFSYSSSDEEADIFLDLEKNTLSFKEEEENISLSIPGTFNLLNSCAALLTAFIVKSGFTLTEAIKKLQSFHGTKRRFELINDKYEVNSKAHGDYKIKIYDDYAHHPSEVQALLASVKTMINGNEKALFIYQPHHPERTQQFWTDFKNTFKKFPENIHVFIPDIYVARSKHIEGINSAKLVEEIKLEHIKYLDPALNQSAVEASKADVQGNFQNTASTLKPIIEEQLKQDKYKYLFIVGAGNIGKVAESFTIC